MAAKAKRNTIKEDASFNKLSPSTILKYDLGTFTFLIIVVAEIASGGETMPPKRNPRAIVKLGIIATEVNATTQEVMMTMGKAKLVITLLHFQNSFQDICQAASYNKGGKKIKNTAYVSIVMSKKADVKVSRKPPNTSTIR